MAAAAAALVDLQAAAVENPLQAAAALAALEDEAPHKRHKMQHALRSAACTLGTTKVHGPSHTRDM